MKPGDLVHVNAVGFYQGIGLIIRVERDFVLRDCDSISYLVLESEGLKHYYSEHELEVLSETR